MLYIREDNIRNEYDVTLVKFVESKLSKVMSSDV